MDKYMAAAKKALTLTLPLAPSINHASITTKNYGKIWSEESKAWMSAAGAIAKAAAREQGWQYGKNEKLILELWAFWPDKRRRDIHNLHKIIADAMEGVLYEDDKMVLVRDMDFCVDRGNPRMELRVRRAEDV